MTNTTVFHLSGYVVQCVVQRMFKDVAAIPLYVPNKVTVLSSYFAFYKI